MDASLDAKIKSVAAEIAAEKQNAARLAKKETKMNRADMANVMKSLKQLDTSVSAKPESLHKPTASAPVSIPAPAPVPERAPSPAPVSAPVSAPVPSSEAKKSNKLIPAHLTKIMK